MYVILLYTYASLHFMDKDYIPQILLIITRYKCNDLQKYLKLAPPQQATLQVNVLIITF